LERIEFGDIYVDLEAILRGLEKNTSTVQKLLLPTLLFDHFNLLLEWLPKFTHLREVKFEAWAVPLSLRRKLLLAFKRNGCLVESTIDSPIMDQVTSDKLAAYHGRNRFLPLAIESAIEEKATEKDDKRSGKCVFPCLLKATIVATAASQGPTRVFDVLVRCEDRIGPLPETLSRKYRIGPLPETLSRKRIRR
jgi:hypothetical protein